MLIYPAIDILNGKCVRLTQGNYEDECVYGDDPFTVAKRWKSEGAKFLHIVDLDGAKDGEGKNEKIISKIVKEVGLPVQIGGGIRSMENIEQWLEVGVERVILGSTAIENRGILEEAVKRFGKRIVVGIDAKDGFVSIHGWKTITGERAVDFASDIKKLGVQTIIYTDIAKDGMLCGPNLEAISEMVRCVKMEVIASGGVGNVGDIRSLVDTGVGGVVVGKALYTGGVELAKAIEIAERGE